MSTQNILIVAVALVVVITAVYKVLPYRLASGKKPFFTLLPKYRKPIDTSLDVDQLDKKLAQYGFKKTKSDGNFNYYTRGSLLGDFSVNLIKVKLRMSKPQNRQAELTLEASWVVAFDTGDFWLFISELGQKLENA
ncbi:hypothetical protein [Marinobacter zhejiangensis]|uniref:Uncharacterized protein n=1 Tax=Marinobacter zhejiangensis TaxID=488535 RepID=A0A1I4T2L0_9GAMM|nr:hypothetical protein [Marinobacter zhejiangensis]SFM70810.1 hypothetical protein SAMN04487963_3452 [Marinobacter zhejiangensis]